MKTTLGTSSGWVCLVLVLAGCASNQPIDLARRQINAGQSDAAIATLDGLIKADPQNREAMVLYVQQRERRIAQLQKDADIALSESRWSDAAEDYRHILALDKTNRRGLEGLAQTEQSQRAEAMLQEVKQLLVQGDLVTAEIRLRQLLANVPNHRQAKTLHKLLLDRIATQKKPGGNTDALSEQITLDFRNTPLRSVFEALSKSSGMNFVLDSDVKGDTRINIFVKQTSLEEIVKLLLTTHQLERKTLNDNSILIYPRTPAKAKDYQELEARSFVLANVDVKQALNLVKTVVKTKDVFVDEKRSLLVIRDTPEAIQLVERLLESLDVAEPEVMLELEVLEVSRSRLRNLGLRFADQIGYGVQNSDTGALSSGVANLRQSIMPFSTNPALLINLRAEDGDANLLANPKIRVRNMEKAKIHIGDKLPVFTTTSTANVGVSAAVNYLDVGLKLEVEPNIYLHEEVGIRIGLEVSSVTSTVTGPQGSVAYQIGNRSASTVLRLKDGETQILAGLISDEERNSANRLPGLGDIPYLGRLFTNRNDNHNKTEIVLLVTPRIIRNLSQTAGAVANISAGTESAIGAPPLKIRTAPPGSLGISGVSTGGLASQPQGSPAWPEVPSPVALPEIPLAPPPAVVVPPPAPANQNGGSVQ